MTMQETLIVLLVCFGSAFVLFFFLLPLLLRLQRFAKKDASAPVTGNTRGFFFVALQIAFVITLGLSALYFWIEIDRKEALFIAAPIVYVLRFAVLAIIVAGGTSLARYFSRRMMELHIIPVARWNAFGISLVLLVTGWLYSYGLVWGGLYTLVPGTPQQVVGTVTASGARHGKSSHGHGEWVEVQVAGRSHPLHLETGDIYSLFSDNGSQDSYTCPLSTAQKGDTLRLVERTSFLGIAVDRFIPLNDRLITACEASR